MTFVYMLSAGMTLMGFYFILGRPNTDGLRERVARLEVKVEHLQKEVDPTERFKKLQKQKEDLLEKMCEDKNAGRK